MPTVVVIRRTR